MYARYMILYPRDSSEQIKARVKRQLTIRLTMGICALVFVIIGGVFIRDAGELKQVEELVRGTSDDGQKDYNLVVKGIEDETLSFELTVHNQKKTREEILLHLKQIATRLKTCILGENSSLDHITKKLDLPETLEGVSINWVSSDSAIITDDGQPVHAKDPKDGVSLTLFAYMNYAGEELVEKIPVLVDQSAIGYDEFTYDDYSTFLTGTEKTQDVYGETFRLPTKWNNYSLEYYVKTEGDDFYIFFFFLAIAVATSVGAMVWDDHQKSEMRSTCIRAEYSTVITRLSDLMITGYPVRNAWHKVVTDYLLEVEKKHTKTMNYALEEMCIAERKIELGVSEIQAYKEFAIRCGGKNYTRMVETLEQCIHGGRKDMYYIWREEINNAMEEKKNLAVMKAGKSETKILMPMMIILAAIMLAIMYPAFIQI